MVPGPCSEGESMGATGWICAICAWACITVGAHANLRIDKGISAVEWLDGAVPGPIYAHVFGVPPLASSFDPIPLILRKGANLS